MVMVANNHSECDAYFMNLYQAVFLVMEKVYAEHDAHLKNFVGSGFVTKWNGELVELAKGRWIDTLFGISSLLSITTQLTHMKNTGKLCLEHGTPFLKLAEAAQVNIATNIIKDSQIHLASISRSFSNEQFNSDQSEEKQHQLKRVLFLYQGIINAGKEIVIRHSNLHSVEMVFAQFNLQRMIEGEWLRSRAA